MSVKSVPLFIDGKFFPSVSREKKEVIDPSNQEILAQVPFANKEEMDQAVQSAKSAFLTWKEVPVPERARLFFEYQKNLKKEKAEIAKILSQENGKTFEDAKGDVWRGIEVVEQ